MANTISIQLKKEPTALYNLWEAFLSRNAQLKPGEAVPELRILRKNIPINKKHMAAFYRVCRIEPMPKQHIVYPFALAYPYIMRLLCSKHMPFSMFRVLNTRNSITVYRALSEAASIDILCRSSPIRAVPKGIEIEIISEISDQEGLLWRNIAAYYCRGKFKGHGAVHEIPTMENLKEATVIDQWYFEAMDRFRFARISGDTNGIHYLGWYARMFGFDRDFAQPIRIAARCVYALQEVHQYEIVNHYPLKFDFFLKGPVYYDKTLTLKERDTGTSFRFDLYCQDNERPCICGSLARPETTSKGSRKNKFTFSGVEAPA